MSASGSSMSMVSSDISKYSQTIQGMYEQLARNKKKLSQTNTDKNGNVFSYRDFYDALIMWDRQRKRDDLETVRTSPEVQMIRTTLTNELCSLMSRYRRVKKLEFALLKEQVASVKRVLAGLSVLYVVMTISLTLGAYVSSKSFFASGKIMKGVQIVCIFGIILTIVSVIISLLILNSRTKLKELDALKDTVRHRFNIFDNFVFGGTYKINEHEKLIDLLSTMDEINQDPKNSDKFKTKLVKEYYKGKYEKQKETMEVDDIKRHAITTEEDNLSVFNSKDYLMMILSFSYEQQLMYLWDLYIIKIIENVHREGTGVERLSMTESKSDPIRILQGTNQILSNYYKLMLKTYQSPDANVSNEAILDILDSTVVKELQTIRFNDDKTYSDEEVVDKLNQSIQFSLMKSSIKQMLIYMYLPWKMMNYKKIMTFYFPESDLAFYYGVTIDDNDKTNITKFMSSDPAAKEIVDRYPLLRVNYIDEIKLMEQYASSVSTEEQKQIVDAYIEFSVQEFNNAFDYNHNAYTNEVNDATDERKQKAYRDYVEYFNTYFSKIYEGVIDKVLMTLNPNKSQLYVFDTKFMRDVIEEVIESSNVLKVTEAKYRFYMIDTIITSIVQEQKQRFLGKFVVSNDKIKEQKTINEQYIAKQTANTTKRIAAIIAPYQISLSNYNKYLYKKVFTTSNNLNPTLLSRIDNVLMQIDFEASLIRKLQSTIPDDDDTRFVLPQNFVSSINALNYSVLKNSLRVNDLQEIVQALDVNQSGLFIEQEKSISQSKLYLTGAIITSILGYVIWWTLTHSRFVNISDFRDVEPVTALQKLDTEQLRSYNTTIVREILVSGVPVAIIALFIAIFSSFLNKKQADLSFNKERITQNTNAINKSIGQLKQLMHEFDSKIKRGDEDLQIKDIVGLTDDDKLKLYNTMKPILINYDKCNYIIGASKGDLPFPYAEVFADGLMIIVIICVAIFVLIQFGPLERLMELKDLFEFKETAETLVNDASFIKEISMKFNCHTDNVESIMMTVKLVFATSIIIFMFLYTIKVVNSTNLYKVGLYNSKYFEKSKCR